MPITQKDIDTAVNKAIAAYDQKMQLALGLKANTSVTDTLSANISSISATPASPPSSEDFNPENINKNIKIATSNLFVDQSSPTVSAIADMLFQSFPVSELITNTTNFSLIGGGTESVITNIKEISDKFSSYNLSRLSDSITTNSFRLTNFIPASGSGGGVNGATVYISTDNQYIYIEIANANNKELVEYQVISQSTVLDATI